MCVWSNAILQAKVFKTKVDFAEGEKPEKNPRSTTETNYNNFSHMSSKFLENQREANREYRENTVNWMKTQWIQYKSQLSMREQ